jgi:hypothetical protein
MTDSLLDDVTSLLNGDFGDDRILKQIARACKNNEVISNYERNYVQKLAEQYLDKKPEITNITIPDDSISDDSIPKIETSISSQIFESQPSSSSNFNLKNSKLFLGFGGVALIIIIAAAILLSNNTDSFSSNPESPLNVTLSVNTDLNSYTRTDLISINGVSNNTKIVNLSIVNQNNELVWAEQVSVKNDGQYSTLAIADGSGWEISGTYTLKVENGSEIKSITFLFNS